MVGFCVQEAREETSERDVRLRIVVRHYGRVCDVDLCWSASRISHFPIRSPAPRPLSRRRR